MTKLHEPEPVATGAAADFISPSPTAPGDLEDRAGTAQAMVGRQFRVTQQRGKPMPADVAEAIIAKVAASR